MFLFSFFGVPCMVHAGEHKHDTRARGVRELWGSATSSTAPFARLVGVDATGEDIAARGQVRLMMS
jgi:hypothetical protein